MRADKLGIKALHLIREYLLSDALDLLYSYHLREDREKSIIHLTARLVRLSRLKKNGLISSEFYCLQENKIINSMVELSYAIKSEGDKKK